MSRTGRVIRVASFLGMLAFADAGAMDRTRTGETVMVDLDGDGRSESVRVEQRGNDEWRGLFRLTVGTSVLDDSLGDRIDGVRVIDIDSTDAFRELSVETEGPSDDYVSRIYRWDKGAFRFVREITDFPEYPGDGTMIASFLCGFWFRREHYRWDAERLAFVWLPRTRHPVEAFAADDAGARARVRLELAAEPGDSSIVATIEAGSPVHFVEWQPPLPPYEEARIEGNSGWYRVRGSDGVAGWIAGPRVDDIDGMLYPD